MRTSTTLLGLIAALSVSGCGIDVSGRLDPTSVVRHGWGGETQIASRADTGSARAQRVLGDMYFLGEGGVPRDERTAVNYWRLAADGGNADAQARLAAYEAGQPVPLYHDGSGAREFVMRWVDDVNDWRTMK